MTYQGTLSDISASWISGKLNIVEVEKSDEIIIHEDTNLTYEDELVHSLYEDGKLDVRYCASGYRFRNNLTYKKELTLKYAKYVDKLAVALTSGDLRANTLTNKDVNIAMTSGSVIIDEIESEKINAAITSGSFLVGMVETDTFNFAMTSGNAEVNFMEVDEAKLKGTSGIFDIKIPEEGATVTIKKTTGSIKINREYTKDGNKYVFGNGSAKIAIEVTSGKVTIS